MDTAIHGFVLVLVAVDALVTLCWMPYCLLDYRRHKRDLAMNKRGRESSLEWSIADMDRRRHVPSRNAA